MTLAQKMFVYDFSILRNFLVMLSWQMEFSQNENILSIKNEMNIEFVFCGNIKTK
jgi:hypothetical protein